ncbi:MAG TPA: LacI family DNA-binding transcriptional regulator [Anaerolineaceae bacterium]
MSVTLSDVARHAGVSIKTVSRVVNNQGEVSKDTRQRVLAAIQQMGYQPNVLARSLVMQRSYTIAIVSWGLDQYSPSRFVMGVAREADEQGYSILLTLLRRSKQDNVELVLNSLVSRRVDGIIWHAPRVGNNQDWICPERLAQMPPLVLNGLPNPHVMTVSVDNRYGARLAVQHLVDQGWRRIGIITGLVEHPMAAQRTLGWQDVLQENGLECDDSLIANGDWTAQSGEIALETLLHRRPDIDAVFACNDLMGMGALSAAARAGRRVCRDLGVIGYENIPGSEYCSPPLSTMHQSIFELGREAVRLLVARIQARANGEDLPPELHIAYPELVVRQSSLHCNGKEE